MAENVTKKDIDGDNTADQVKFYYGSSSEWTGVNTYTTGAFYIVNDGEGKGRIYLATSPTTVILLTTDLTDITGTFNNYLPLAGGNMSGPIDMGQQKITNLAAPKADDDAATKLYVDALGTEVSDIKKQLKNVSTVMDFIGVATADPSTGDPKVAGVSSYQKGDVTIYPSTGKEYLYDGENWVEIGQENASADAIKALHLELYGKENGSYDSCEATSVIGKIKTAIDANASAIVENKDRLTWHAFSASAI